MPVFLKRWYIRKLIETKKKEKKQQETSMGKSKGVSRMRRPQVPGSR